MNREPSSLMDRIQEQLDPIQAATLKALKLFLEIRDSVGDTNARWIFAKWGEQPTQARLNEIKNMRIIDRLDLMPGGPNVKELARQIARETTADPTPQEINTVERHIQKLNKKRKQTQFWPQREG